MKAGDSPRGGRVLHRAAARGLDQLRLQRLVRLPQLAVVDAVDRLPEARCRGTRGPVRTEVAVVHLAHLIAPASWERARRW